MFENWKFRMKEELSTVKRIYNTLYDFLENKELYSTMHNYLYNPLSDGFYIAFCSENEVCLKSMKSKNDMFHLCVTPNLNNIETLAMKIIKYDGRHEEEIITQFSHDSKRAIVTKKIIEKIVQGKKQEVVSIKNKDIIKSYVDNYLRYDYKYETETCFRLKQNYSKSSLSEVFIDESKKAVKRTALICEDDFSQDPATITYYETSQFSEPPFDDRYNSGNYNYGMSITTKEKFDEFVNSNDNVAVLKR